MAYRRALQPAEPPSHTDLTAAMAGIGMGFAVAAPAKEPNIEEFTLKNASGMTAKLTNYGTILMELHVPDRDGTTADVVLDL